MTLLRWSVLLALLSLGAGYGVAQAIDKDEKDPLAIVELGAATS